MKILTLLRIIPSIFLVLVTVQASATDISMYEPITSIWGAGTKRAIYTPNNKNKTLRIQGQEPVPDADFIAIGELDNEDKKCDRLIVTLQSMKGNFPWGGKSFGISIDRVGQTTDANSSIVAPMGFDIENGFVRDGVRQNQKLKFDITDKETVYIVAKVFVGMGTDYTLKFEAKCKK